jgi:drug/metabolite transporter (DMT)-like permease
VEFWIVLTIVAAFLQTLRSSLQKRATGMLSVNGASYLRFVYALPFVWGYLGFLLVARSLPELPVEFFVFCVTGGVAQIVATAALVGSFAHGNFALGTTFSKTEVVLTALVGAVVLSESLSGAQWAGVGVSFFGVAMLSARGGLRNFLTDQRALGLGVLAGAGFAVSAVCYRAAALSLPEGDFLIRAGITLAITVTVQSLLMGLFLQFREAGELRKVFVNWRSGIWVGLLGASASAAWFSAMTLVNAALVRAVGQVELLFSFAISIWIFHERVRPVDIAGAALVVFGIWLLL